MSSLDPPPQPQNPFSTCRVRPGAIPFQFPPGSSPEQLVERLRANRWWGEVVGPHGSGKSSLLAALVPALQQAGCRILHIELHDGQRTLPIDLAQWRPGGQPALVIVDGYEQLSWWRRLLLKQRCRRSGLGLLVTSHKPVGLPHLFSTCTNLALAEQIVAFLLAGRSLLLGREELEKRFIAHQGDLRELLFDLYDLYERDKAAQPDAPEA